MKKVNARTPQAFSSFSALFCPEGKIHLFLLFPVVLPEIFCYNDAKCERKEGTVMFLMHLPFHEDTPFLSFFA
ncbi:MAG TPA: hypothetical protein IAA94_08710 [Candidatus Galloscillospira stercoripullorum]|nr:hypothetical protein [Candidatus Galloscillospira stercoripullorum]